MNISVLADQTKSVDTLFTVKKKLSMLLDSLELEKQTRIRNDQSFEDLENECRKIRDSINTVKEILNSTDFSIQKPVEAVQKKSSSNSFFKSLLKPKDAFDWVIFVIGSITFLSIIILFIGICNTFLFNSAKGSKTSSAKKTMKPPIVQSSLSSSNKPDSVSDSFVDIDNKNINNLREIINNDIKSLKQFNINSSPFSTSDLKSEKNGGRLDEGLSISEKIVNSANEGLTVLEISRKYHISVNKVSLVLQIQDINKLKKR
jgi:hypothetical protein